MPQRPKPSKSRGKGFTLRPLPAESASAEGATPPAREPFDHLGDLPHGYGSDTIFLVAQEPKWLFTYWDIDINRHPGGAAYLRAYAGDGAVAVEIEVPFETRNWYIPVEKASTDYFVEIGYYRGDVWNLIARSVVVTTPPETMAASAAFDYATIPFHLSFQRLLDHLQSARDSGEDLVQAVARLQGKGDFSAFGVGALADLLTPDQQSLLRALMGPDLLSELASAGLSSDEMERRIRAYLEEQMTSGGGSETLHSFREAVSAISSAGFLSSHGGATSWDVGALSSWAAGALASWAAAGNDVSSLGLTSWTAAGEVGGSATTSWGGASTSWSAGSAMASGETASWAGGASTTSWGAGAAGGSWTSKAFSSWLESGLSSWLAGAPTSGGSTELTSWLQGVHASWLQGLTSSWAEAALSSWNHGEFSSWAAAETSTSWGGASETLSSAFSGARDFFMHVNAELIFYGGTDPRATVTIAGEPVTLSRDGTFRHHFVFPNADYEIPIVAQSPDGVETRSATLRFHRDTAKSGVVTDTPQPPLGAPMGQV